MPSLTNADKIIEAVQDGAGQTFVDFTPDTAGPTGLFTQQQNDDDDDKTVDNGFSPSTTKPSNTKTIKLVFQPKANYPMSKVPSDALGIMIAIKGQFGDSVKIYTNRGQEFKDEDLVDKGQADFQKHYTIHSKKGRSRQLFWLIFRIESDVSLHEIRRNQTVNLTLRKCESRIVYYPWNEDIGDVEAIGFYIGASPRHSTTESFEAKFKKIITDNTKLKPQQVPKFRATMANVSMGTATSRGTCQAYEIQVERENKAAMIKAIGDAFGSEAITKSEHQRFMYFSHRQKAPPVFAKGVCLQMKYEQNHRVVAIQGVSRDAMFYLESKLKEQYTELMEVLETRKSSTEGRWNLLCEKSSFRKLATSLSTELSQLHDQVLMEQGLSQPSRFPQTTIASRIPGSDNSITESSLADSLNSRDSYMSASEEFFASLDLDDDDAAFSPPEPKVPHYQPYRSGYTSQPNYSYAAAARATQSPPGPSNQNTIDELMKSNQRLTALVASLQTQIQQMQQHSTQVHIQPLATPPSDLTSSDNRQYLDIIQRLERMEAMAPQQSASTSPPRKLARTSSVSTKDISSSSRQEGDPSKEGDTDEDMNHE